MKEFSIAKYILEEDTDEIPLIEYEFGRNGKPYIVTHTKLAASKYFPILVNSVGAGNFDYTIGVGNDDMDDDLYEVNDELDLDNKLIEEQ